MNIIKAKEMNNKPIEEQLQFYKQYFEESSCAMYGWELGNDWVMYKDLLYRTEAFEKIIEEEKSELNARIESLNNQIKAATSELDKLEGEI
ncbi:hypothetical protein [Paenibacillus sp. USHLN196]|uniref:hypothetical protein n=1 Tax=Paenibacillus sp. USHLN196 TaxID=3081291 RepID=UPI00301A0D03